MEHYDFENEKSMNDLEILHIKPTKIKILNAKSVFLE